MKRTIGIESAAFLFLALCASCGSGNMIEPPPPIVVSILPETAHVIVTQSVQFTATVYNADSGGVTWSLSSADPAYGTLSSSGLYRAPASVPDPPRVWVKATSVADTSISATVEVTIILDADLWAWISGSDLANQPGVYGTKGIPAPTNVPGARSGAASWMDAQGRLWLFGGESRNDLWQYDPASGQWTWESGSDAVNKGGQYGTRGLASPGNFPGARTGAVSWVDSQGRLWLFGGTGLGQEMPYSGTLGPLNDVWSFDPGTLEWTWIAGSDTVFQLGVYGTKGVASPSNVIGSRHGAVCWLDPHGQVWVFGGRGLNSKDMAEGPLNDLWRFDPATLEWTWIAGSDIFSQPGHYGTKGLRDPANVPGSRYGAISWTDSQGRLWLFGGLGMDAASETGALNDLWMFDPGNLEWTWAAGSDAIKQPGVYGTKGAASPANHPGARTEAVSWVDPEDRFWLFGGSGTDSVGNPARFNDLWLFERSTLLWTWVAGTDAPNQLGVYGIQGVSNWLNAPGARSGAAGWTDPGGNLWLFGGGGLGTTLAEGSLNDLWRFVR